VPQQIRCCSGWIVGNSEVNITGLLPDGALHRSQSIRKALWAKAKRRPNSEARLFLCSCIPQREDYANNRNTMMNKFPIERGGSNFCFQGLYAHLIQGFWNPSRHNCTTLSTPKPICNPSRIKSDACADPERWDSSCGGVFEDGDPGYREELREFLRCKGTADLLDMICERHSSNLDNFWCFTRSGRPEFATVPSSAN